MNAEHLLTHFDRLADAPDAIPRLRRFILDLAVRGKLVEQDPEDKPAGELLKRIAEEKAHLVKAGKIRKQDTEAIAIEEYPYKLPLNWIWSRLGAIGDWGSGSTPRRGGEGLYGGGITWLKSGELNDDPRLSGSEETVTKTAVEKGTFRGNQPGDVLIAMYGATIGKVAILAEYAVTNQAVCGCTPFRRYCRTTRLLPSTTSPHSPPAPTRSRRSVRPFSTWRCGGGWWSRIRRTSRRGSC